jgi:hypothetical protein
LHSYLCPEASDSCSSSYSYTYDSEPETPKPKVQTRNCQHQQAVGAIPTATGAPPKASPANPLFAAMPKAKPRATVVASPAPENFPIRNAHSGLDCCGASDLYDDILTGPASVIIMQNFVPALAQAADQSKFFVQTTSSGGLGVIAKKSRVRGLEVVSDNDILVAGKPLLSILVVQVRLAVTFCNMSSISVASCEFTNNMSHENIEFVASKLRLWILQHDIRLIGGRFGLHLIPFVKCIRGSGVNINLAAWLPFVSQDRQDLLMHQNCLLITGPVEAS